MRAVAAVSTGLAVRREGRGVPVGDLPRRRAGSGTRRARSSTCRRSTALDPGSSLPVVVGDDLLGSLELLHDQAIDDAACRRARLAAAQVALAIRAYVGTAQRREPAAGDVLRPRRARRSPRDPTPSTRRPCLRLALELTGAEGAVLWRLDADG